MKISASERAERRGENEMVEICLSTFLSEPTARGVLSHRPRCCFSAAAGEAAGAAPAELRLTNMKIVVNREPVSPAQREVRRQRGTMIRRCEGELTRQFSTETATNDDSGPSRQRHALERRRRAPAKDPMRQAGVVAHAPNTVWQTAWIAMNPNPMNQANAMAYPGS